MPDSRSTQWYFDQLDDLHFAPTIHVSGGWNPDEQHIAPVFGLLTHLVEQHRDRRRGADLAVGRLSFDILGVLPLAPFRVELQVLRPGRTIELVEARVISGERTAVVLRAWLMAGADTHSIMGNPFSNITALDATPAWNFSEVWPGGFVRSVEARRDQVEAGKCSLWVKTPFSLLEGVEVSPTARMMGLIDVANGATPRALPEDVAFPNLDLTAHLLRAPVGPWIGLDTSVGIGPGGIGITHSLIHDEMGFVGTASQSLTVRPRQSVN